MDAIECVVIHSGGMDSSICLKLAEKKYGPSHVVSLGFNYHQRHCIELESARKMAQDWGITRHEIDASVIQELTSNSLVDREMTISGQGQPLNTLVLGRNGLMCWLAALYAFKRGCLRLSTGVIGIDGANSGYRDCSRAYMDRLQEVLRMDLGSDRFEILTPVVNMDKCETLELSHSLGILHYLLENTVTCYEGIRRYGCGKCPACILRNEGIYMFDRRHPGVLAKEQVPAPLR